VKDQNMYWLLKLIKSKTVIRFNYADAKVFSDNFSKREKSADRWAYYFKTDFGSIAFEIHSI